MFVSQQCFCLQDGYVVTTIENADPEKDLEAMDDDNGWAGDRDEEGRVRGSEVLSVSNNGN